MPSMAPFARSVVIHGVIPITREPAHDPPSDFSL